MPKYKPLPMQGNLVQRRLIVIKKTPELAPIKILPYSESLLNSVVTSMQSKVSAALDNVTENIKKVFNIGGIPTNFDKMKARIVAEVETLLPNVATDDTYALYATLLTAFPYFALTSSDRKKVLAQMTAIAMGESGLNPRAKFIEGKKVAAYGFLQHRKSNWKDHSNNFVRSTLGKKFAASGVLTKIADLLGVDYDTLTNPVDLYGDRGMNSIQIIPMLAQTAMLRDKLDKFFIWNGSSWDVASTKGVNLAKWNSIKQSHHLLLEKREAGEQALLTLMHIMGAYFLFNDTPVEKYALDRMWTDAARYGVLMSDPAFDDYITRARGKWSKLDSLFGDPVKDDPKGKKKKKVTGYVAFTRPSGAVRYVNKDDLGLKHPWSRVSSDFDPDRDPVKTSATTSAPAGHYGVDIDVRYEPVLAIGNANITKITHNMSKEKGFGHAVYLEFTDGSQKGWSAIYAHLDKISLPAGTKTVVKGQQIGISGMTGAAKGPHLHLEIIDPNGYNRNPANPDVPFDLRDTLANPTQSSLNKLIANYKKGLHGNK